MNIGADIRQINEDDSQNTTPDTHTVVGTIQPNVICNSLTSRSVIVRTKGADTAADHLASDRKMLLLSLPIPGPVRKHRNIVRA